MDSSNTIDDVKKSYFYLTQEDYKLIVSHYGTLNALDVLSKLSQVYHINSFLGKSILSDIMLEVKHA